MFSDLLVPSGMPSAVKMISGAVGNLQLELYRGKADGMFSHKPYVAIVCHPHPLHGGSMKNKVVTTLARVYRDLGVATVTFNFRGVGQSEGQYGNLTGELDDLLSVDRWVRAECPNASVLLAGFSFGSSVAAQGAYKINNVCHLTLVAPPVERYPFDIDRKFPVDTCVIQAGQDELVSDAGVTYWASELLGEVDVLRFEEASHFFHGKLTALKQAFQAVLEKRLVS